MLYDVIYYIILLNVHGSLIEINGKQIYVNNLIIQFIIGQFSGYLIWLI